MSLTRPAYSSLINHYPYGSVSEVFNLIGGKVKQNNFTNTCAIRISRSLNYSGLKIDAIKGETVSGGDGLHYIFRVITLKRYLERQFGKPDFKDAPDNLKNKMMLYKGIMVVDVDGWMDARGHATLWGGVNCVDHCYLDKAHQLSLWKMPS